MAKIKRENIDPSDLVVKKPSKPKVPKDLRSVFRFHLKTLDIEKLKKPWMAAKAFRIVDTREDLIAWVKSVIADTTRHFMINGTMMPVVALDTETIGLDTRTFYKIDVDGQPVYEVMIDIAGLCLSSNGIEGIYIPLHHEFADKSCTTPAQNLSREEVIEILQPLFDICHLVFYNAKFDREILRICLGARLRSYPYFEDVQVLHYIVDPKADVGDAKRGQYTGDTGGLKALSKKLLQLEQIDLDELVKVKADYCPVKESGFCKCTAEERKINKHTQRVQYVPFTWVPLDITLWYAAADAICTWLLWEHLHNEAMKQKLVHKIDQELVDSLSWIERQRFLVDIARRARTVKWHEEIIHKIEEELRVIAVKAGWKVETEEDGTVISDTVFNPSSNPQIGKLLFGMMGLKPTKKTAMGAPSCDAEALGDLQKNYPDNDFLKLYAKYKEYIALHPENLSYDPRDNSARIFLKQTVVAGGRLSGAGGNFPVDGGFGLNPQGIVRVEGNWWVKGNVLEPDTISTEEIEPHAEADLHPSCYKEVEEETVVGWKETIYIEAGDRLEPQDSFFPTQFPEDLDQYQYPSDHPSRFRKPVLEKHKVRKQAPNIVNNHIGFYQGYAICLVPSCTTCDKKFNVIWKNGRADAAEVVNIRGLFSVAFGWTFFTIDYSNIEMRAAANVSKEPEFIKEFLEGAGDFHSLTASKVFPEFNDPNTPKAQKKALRSLAKIINFALLYGGTAYTIFENMRKQNPNITWDEAKAMVEKYWAGVPVFADWCANKQAIAREQMICKTSTGRVINFKSAMEALHIHVPNKIEMDNFYEWRRSCKKEEELAASDDPRDQAEASRLKDYNNRIWRNVDTGVRNVQDYNRFTGKIGRVAVNVPLQGLAGDFMRISLNKICQWASQQEPDVQSVLRLHCSVHDEIDFAVKNEYVPFVLPRISRLMKLRKFHKAMDWKVPIECDVEYGKSWDVEYHVTGDDGHKPAAWTAVPGMEMYIPTQFDSETVKHLVKAIESGVDARRDKAKAWLKDALHERAFGATKPLFEAKTHKEIVTALVAVLQLHEFWTTDNVPDEGTLETLEQYEARNGLSPQNRGTMPPTGFLGHVPPSQARYPEIMRLGVESPTEEFTGGTLPLETAGESEQAPALSKPDASDVLLDTPTRRRKRVVSEASSSLPVASGAIPELIDLTPDVVVRLKSAVGLGKGTNTVRFRYADKVFTLEKTLTTEIPGEFLKSRTPVEATNAG